MIHPPASRRRFLSCSASLAAAAALPLAITPVQAATVPSRDLALFHAHTQETLDVVYAVGPRYLPDALGSLNHLLRDHYTGAIGRMDPQLFDLLHRVRQLLGNGNPFEVYSAYREPVTNQHLRQTREGGVAVRSLHMEGRAIDLYLPGSPLAELRDAALSLRAGGVGYYPRDGFVHIDTGRVRSW